MILFRPAPHRLKWQLSIAFVAASLVLCWPQIGQAKTVHVWEKVEITLQAQNTYENPYADVKVWLHLKGPGFDKRCYGFWDGDNTYCVRVMATVPGMWTWLSGSNQSDSGLNGKKGYFTAAA